MVVDQETAAVRPSLRSVLLEADATLRGAGVDNARLDARLLVGHALGLDSAALVGVPERPLGADEVTRVAALVTRRAAREPLAQILGEREFWSLPIRVTPAVLMATSVPQPMAMPTSAAARAGASLMPSPTIATVAPSSLSRLSSDALSCGKHSATTRSMPTLLATDVAVRELSPVIITVSTPSS